MKIDVPPAGAANAYYLDAASWAHDHQTMLRASRRIAWIIAGCACVVALVEAAALASLAPLKTTVPYVITVDRETGFTQLAQGLKPGPLSQDTALTQAFLAQYVLARETFDVNDLQPNYRKVAQWTVGPARGQYIRGMMAVNPESPLAKYPRTTVVQTIIQSVSLLSRNSALVRFRTLRTDADNTRQQTRIYDAVIGFRFSGQPLSMDERLINPLGFQVTGYRRDAETTASDSAGESGR